MNDMRAALFDSYGPPDVLYEGKVPVPTPKQDEVLVKVHAVSINGAKSPPGRGGYGCSPAASSRSASAWTSRAKSPRSAPR